jgi:diaminopimelate epimerase
MRTWSFVKGHGTRNDFVVLKDRSAMMRLTDADVRYLCDRRGGVGGDGLLRAVKAEHIAEWDGDPDLWFMDYRNADGSIAEMCGNGLRLFVRVLLDCNLIGFGPVSVATRAGLRTAVPLPDGRISVTMGAVAAAAGDVTVRVDGLPRIGTEISVGNPHCVVEVSDEEVSAARLTELPEVPADRYPDGANVELAARVGERHYRMRVYERGVGETESCGTGAVAVAYALGGGTPGTYRVDVPGGSLDVVIDTDGSARLIGPAVVTAKGGVSLPD